jgi:hypothetical protein
VVKDPTYLDPSLVTEVKDSSLTILHQIYPFKGVLHRFRKRRCTPVRVSVGGAHHLRKGSSFFFEEVGSTANLVLGAISIIIAPFSIGGGLLLPVHLLWLGRVSEKGAQLSLRRH